MCQQRARSWPRPLPPTLTVRQVQPSSRNVGNLGKQASSGLIPYTLMYQLSQDTHIQYCCMSHQLMPPCFHGRRFSRVGLVVWESSCFCLDMTGHWIGGV